MHPLGNSMHYTASQRYLIQLAIEDQSLHCNLVVASSLDCCGLNPREYAQFSHYLPAMQPQDTYTPQVFKWPLGGLCTPSGLLWRLICVINTTIAVSFSYTSGGVLVQTECTSPSVYWTKASFVSPAYGWPLWLTDDIHHLGLAHLHLLLGILQYPEPDLLVE